MANIVDSFHAKLDPFNRRTVAFEQIKEEPVDELIRMEVTAQNSEYYESQQQNDSFSEELVATNINGTKEKWTFYSILEVLPYSHNPNPIRSLSNGFFIIYTWVTPKCFSI